ncbi:unnamed protein product [Microthlaspi erraticum]|uniref:Uncharacterized protein n=1 Tax=Microthlaspi erraticum TaxID=1685480 RepID=A0A6D2IR79_9BRAS|nr:unnamed protein product [Microthlaspi erraticum]
MKWYVQCNVAVRRGQAAVRDTLFDWVCAARSSLLLFFFHLFILEVSVAPLSLVELCSLEAVVRSPVALREVLVGRWIVLESRVLEQRLLHVNSTLSSVEFTDRVGASALGSLPLPLRVVSSFPSLE